MKTTVKILLLNLMLFISGWSSANDLAEQWKFKTNGRVYASPVILDSVMYIGSLDGKFYAINILDGSEKWSYSTEEEIRTTAAIYDSIICFAGGNRLFALNLEGDTLWTFQMYEGDAMNSHDAWDDFNSSPALVDSIAYIGTEHGMIYGINIITGEELFYYQTTGQYTIETTPAIYDGKIYFGDWDGVFHCVNIASETEEWVYDTKEDNTYGWVNAILTKPVIMQDSVYFAGRSCNLYCLNSQTGDKIWMHHDEQNMWLLGGPVIEDTVIYLGSSNQRIIQGFHIDREELLWTTEVDYRVFGTPFLTEEYVFFGTGMETGDNFGSLLIMDKYNHQLLARFPTEGQVHSSPLVLDSIVYFGSSDSYIYAVNHNVMLSKEAAHTYLKDISIVQLGELDASDPVEAEVYVYNDGEGADSVEVSCTYDNVLLTPQSFTLPANDSQLVTVNIDLSGMEPKSYSVDIKFLSHNSVLSTQLTKRYSFRVLGSTGTIDFEADKHMSFDQNKPNPFSEYTRLSFFLNEHSKVRLIIYDALGKEIAVLLDCIMDEGSYEVNFNASGLHDGMYFCQLQTKSGMFTRRMLKISR